MKRLIARVCALSLAATLLAAVVAQAETATWYGPGFEGNLTASGDTFDPNGLTAASPSYPFGTMLLVTNVETGAQVVVRVNDRGPFGGGPSLDLSRAAADAIGITEQGVAPVTVVPL